MQCALQRFVNRSLRLNRKQVLVEPDIFVALRDRETPARRESKIWDRRWASTLQMIDMQGAKSSASTGRSAPEHTDQPDVPTSGLCRSPLRVSSPCIAPAETPSFNGPLDPSAVSGGQRRVSM